MQFMNAWATADRKTLLHFSGCTLDTFAEYIQVKDTDCEAGGLLLGTVHGAHMLIEEATVPTELDRRSQYQFERMPFGHEAVALERWMASQGTVRYLGEWHTHLEDYPSPSGLDRIEWNCLSSSRRDKRSVLAVIVGRKNLYVELVPGIGRGPALLPIT